MTEQLKPLKKRYQGHKAYNELVKSDWIKSIELSPDRFEAYLFVPEDQGMQEQVDDAYEEQTVIELDANQNTLTYQDPVVVSVLDCPDEQEFFFAMDAGGETLGEGEGPLLLRIGIEPAPEVGSVLEWEEETTDGHRRVWWYVHSSMAYGTSSVGFLSVCIPMRNFNADEGVRPADMVPNSDDAAAPKDELIEPSDDFLELD